MSDIPRGRQFSFKDQNGRPVFIDSFSTGLEGVKGTRARDPIIIYDTILAQDGVFSTFDVTPALAKAVSLLFREKYLDSDPDAIGYPWVKCAATEKGRAWRDGRVTRCAACVGEGHTLEFLNRRNALSHKCKACDGRGFHIVPLPETEVRR